ncbi:MAG: exodeoxyribonuclease VII large subunit [Candidatus Eremiobacteraeota bacterium]|nr:exodeoxyribonuclease VII large subunit [Candidatus Eremiobacteraeota bacterium]
MTSAPRPAPRVVGVKRLADYLKRKLEGDPNLRNVHIRGEISNYSVPKSGHINFDLKESDAVLRCFAWASDVATFPPLGNGMAVVASGSISAYASKSTYQLIVRAVEREGVGDVHALFEARKKKLDAEGLFAAAGKRALPAFPFRVALVSSRAAAGAVDFVTILRARAPHVDVVWCETSVQGPNAPAEIVTALKRASRADVDLIVVTRGGGSFEDLFAFSDENVVRAVAAARHPVLAAIGHTVDQQLCDFAADRHVETPSAAAKAVGFDTHDLRLRADDGAYRAKRSVGLLIERLEGRLKGALVRSRLSQPRVYFATLAQRLGDAAAELDAAAQTALRERDRALRELCRRLEARDPSRRLEERGRRLQAATLRLEPAIALRLDALRRTRSNVAARLEPAARALVERNRQRIALALAHLDGKSPEAILQRGYAIVSYGESIVRDPNDVPAGATIEARLARGTLSARVERKETDGNQRIG